MARRTWFPLAALGFALLVLAGTSLVRGTWFAYTPKPDVRGPGSGALGGTGLPDGRTALVAVTEATAPDPAWGPAIHAGATAWLIALGVVYLATLAAATFRRGVPRARLAGLAAGGLVVLGLADLVAFWQLRLPADVRGPVLLAAGLLVLAAYRRSLPVLLTAVAFVVLDVVLLGGVVGALAGAAVLFAGAFAELLRHPPRTAGDTA